MKVLLTGGTGLVGSSVLKYLISNGHDVVALVRSNESAKAVEANGAEALVGDITDATWLAAQLISFDAVIHTATPSDGSSTPQAMDESVARAVLQALSGTDKRYIHTGGIWVHGNGSDITEETPVNPPDVTAWRDRIETMLMEKDNLNFILLEPGIVYGYGKGLPHFIVEAPKIDNGGLALIGDGSQHWTTIHTDDLGALYVAALEKGSAHNVYQGVSGQNPTVLELTRAASKARGITAEPSKESVDKTKERIYGPLVDALLLDQQARGDKARSLGWAPSQKSLVEELAAGYQNG